MKRYCLDTSGLSNPLQNMPEDIYVSLWKSVCNQIQLGHFATTQEVYDELSLLPGVLGNFIKAHKAEMVLEIGKDEWDSSQYLTNFDQYYPNYEKFIAGTGGSKVSLSVPDFSIVILGKTLSLPVLSEEKRVAHQPASQKCKIPDACDGIGVKHMTFNDFLRDENIRL